MLYVVALTPLNHQQEQTHGFLRKEFKDEKKEENAAKIKTDCGSVS
jgi:hypothetical protein